MKSPKWPAKWPFYEDDFNRMDETSDGDFYSQPRLVYHIGQLSNTLSCLSLGSRRSVVRLSVCTSLILDLQCTVCCCQLYSFVISLWRSAVEKSSELNCYFLQIFKTLSYLQNFLFSCHLHSIDTFWNPRTQPTTGLEHENERRTSHLK